MNPGDRIFVSTGGVTEAANEKKEQYGTGRLQEQLNNRRNSDQKTLLEGILQDIRLFAAGAEQFDDITMLGLAYQDSGDVSRISYGR